MKNLPKFTIIGAGIGGLTTAIALQQKGIDVEIYEAFSAFKDLGAGIILANNAMQVYDRLGLASKLQEAGSPLQKLKVTNHQLKVISAIDANATTTNDLGSTAIHRSALQRVLLSQVPQDKLFLGKRLEAIDATDAGVALSFTDGSTHHGEVVIGADGIHSKVRDAVVAGSEIRDAGQLCWRGVLAFDLPDFCKGAFQELWGKKGRFGFGEISPGRVYWFAVIDQVGDHTVYAKAEIVDIFRDFHPIVQQLISATEADKILTNSLSDLKPISHWHTSHICLIGDAAHATTPNMGQGACQSIEDALALSEALVREETLPQAFAAYENYRKAKANKIVRTSWQIGKMAHMQNGLAITLRNALMRSLPTKLLIKQNAYVYEV